MSEKRESTERIRSPTSIMVLQKHGLRRSSMSYSFFVATIIAILTGSKLQVRESGTSTMQREKVRDGNNCLVGERANGSITNGSSVAIEMGESRTSFPDQGILCQLWKKEKEQNTSVHSIRLTGRVRDNLCAPHRAGNKLLAFFSVKMMSYNQGISFDIVPPCENKASFFAWLPQGIPSLQCSADFEARWKFQEELCEEPARPLPSSGSESTWIRYAPYWSEEIRIGLDSWARELKMPIVHKSTVAIHIRCGDILSARKTEYGFQTLSFYMKHLKGRDIRQIYIITPPLDCFHTLGRQQDCKHGNECSTIVRAVKEALSTSLQLNATQIQIKDNETDLWAMHQIAYSDIVICSPNSSFCAVTSIASKHSVHSVPGNIAGYYKSFIYLEKFLPNSTVVFDHDKYLSIGEIDVTKMNADQIAAYLISH